MSNNEVLDFVLKNYPKEQFDRSLLKEFIEKYRNNIKIVIKKGIIDTVAFFLRLTDETFQKIILDTSILENIETGEKLINEQGKNIHFIQCVSVRGMSILKGLKEVIRDEQPKSVSWFKDDLETLQIIKFRRI